MTAQATTKRSLATPLEQAELPGAMLTGTAAKALAVLRVSTGFIFLWAFLDKTFGFGYATPAAKAWINGGSPTKGFLSSIETGPFASMFNAMAGTWWANWLFMLGMLGVGVALILGIGLRASAVAGSLIMAMMWIAEWPLAQGAGSTNPVMDYHIIYAIALVVAAATYAGHTWGLGRIWASLPLVQKNRWLI